MKKFLLLACFVTSSAFASGYDDPFEKFNATNTMTNSSKIEWIRDRDVQYRCDRESRRRGMGGFKHAIQACSFWGTKDGVATCTIVTSPTPNMHSLGHEMRHCFQGDWH